MRVELFVLANKNNNTMAKYVKGAVQQFKENKRRRTTHPEAQFLTDVGGIAIAKGIRKIFGTTMNNSHSLPSLRKPHIENYVHGMGRVHVNRALHAEKKRAFSGGGMGTRNTTKLLFKPSQHHSMPRAGAGEMSNAYNRSYRSKLAHDVVVDRNPALATASMLSDPLTFTRVQALSKRYLSPTVGKRLSVGNYANARAFLKVNPHMSSKLRTTWYANTAGITNL